MRHLVMSGVLVLATAGVVDGTAHADNPAPKPMMGVGKQAKPCDMVTVSDPKAPKCKAAGSKKIDGLGKVTLLVAGNVKTGLSYALTIDGVDGYTYISEQILVTSDSGMQKSDDPKSATPKLRVIGKKFAVLEVVTKREAGSNTSKTVEKWTKYNYLICKPTESGIPSCTTREFGTPGGGCTATLKDDGALSHGCMETEQL